MHDFDNIWLLLENPRGADLDPATRAAREEHSRPAASPGGGRHRDGAEGQRVQVDLPQQHRLADLLYRPVVGAFT